MTNLLPTLGDHDYKNWVKGGLGLKFAKAGIATFVERNIDQFHKDVLVSLHHCYNCSTANIIPCKFNNNYCKYSKNNCKVHDPKDANKKSRPCRNAVCNVIRDEIVNHHRFRGPSWRNTDSRRWCREPWQLATCYMPDGYAAAKSASETDFPGILSVVINNKVFDTVVTDKLTNKHNVFSKTRDARNSILHKADMRLTDAELARHIATLDNMLSDAKCLAGDQNAIQARSLLQQILNDTLYISTTDEAELRAETFKAIEEKKKEALESIEEKEITSISTVQNLVNLFEGIVNKENKKAVKAIQNEKDIAIKDFNKKRSDTTEDIKLGTYKDAMINLKKELLSVYKDGDHMSTSLGPVAADEDKDIEDLYVDPHMKLVDHQKVRDDGMPVKSYQDIFKAENQKIYIVGEAGMGKTSLCQKMVSTWYQNNTCKKEDMSDNQQAMDKFDYLFYISLRHATTDNTIEEMIKHQLLPNKSNLYEPLSRVLDKEKCLVILDGLDEWTTEHKTATSAQVNRGLPGRDAVRNCTVLTTTRPWKLESLKLKSRQIDTKVKLLGIDRNSCSKLAQNMIKHLNNKFHCHKTYRDFISEINDRKLEQLITIPVILKQIVCLWHAGKRLGKTKTAIYCQMLELFLEIAQYRLNKDSQYQQIKEEWMKSSIKLPSCFDNKETCQYFKPLLVALSLLAFYTLLNGDQDSSLLFKSTKEGCHNLSPEEVSICLKIGILSQDKLLKDCASQYKKISFLHKSFQEFLAAMFVSLDLSNTKQCVKTLKSLCNTGDKCREMSNVLTFIGGTCTSDITCTLVQHYNDNKVWNKIIDCMREGWTCSHDNKHLYCDHIDIDEPSEYLDQLCKVNIPNIKRLWILSPPTSQCLQYLLQIHTLEQLVITSYSQQPPPSEDLLYTLIHHHRHTLTYIDIDGMTLRSNTILSTLITQVSHLRWLGMSYTTLPQQLLTSLHSDRPYRHVVIKEPTILPDTESTD